MPDAYDLHEGRFLQEANGFSAVAGLSATVGPVPANHVWTLLAASYYPSAAETKTVLFYITGRGGGTFAISVPQSVALGPSLPFPALTDGMEMKLFPGETLTVSRDSATAGSTMVLSIRFIASDLPLYDYVEPQHVKRISEMKRTLLGRIRGGVKGGGTVGIPDIRVAEIRKPSPRLK